ncbi:MAG: PDZ domain-containing protein [Spirochaetota bacterium]|jgi:predicted metalloprotease with PDZ domain|nr:PDZ domain-containing protein [Spirochaetota bacterium]
MHKIYVLNTLRPALGLIIILAACVSTGERSQKENPASFRPWGIVGARISNTRAGVAVTEVIPGSTADQAGLRVGDRVLEVGENTGLRAEEIIDDIRRRLPGSVVAIRYSRDGSTFVARVRVGEYPRDEQLWLMASAAAKSLDFERAIALCHNFDQTVPSSSRYAAQMRELKTSVLEKLAKE